MKDVFLLLTHFLTTLANLLGPGGTKTVITENLLLQQQLLVVTRSRRRAPNLSTVDRFFMGFWSLFLRQDPLFEYHRWQANLRILDIEEIKCFRWQTHCRDLVQLPLAA
jgi:hypothetical protein